MKAAMVIVAAGRGRRAGGPLPKQFQVLAGHPVLVHTLNAVLSHPAVTTCVVVLNPADHDLFSARIAPHLMAKVILTDGADSRDGSVRAGLAALPATCDTVLIHDAARPVIAHCVIDRVLTALRDTPGAAPALPVTDALWRGQDGRVAGTQDRSGLFRAQTPQGFRLTDIRAAHAAALATGLAAADDVEVARAHGLDVAIVAGDENNLKITTPEDFQRAETLLIQQHNRS